MSEPKANGNWVPHTLMLFLCVCTPLTLPAHAEDRVYEDHKWGFTISHPEGWRFQGSDTADEQDGVRVSMYGPDSRDTAETCNVTATDTPASRNFTQAQINAAVRNGALATTALNDLRKVDPAATLRATKVVQLGKLNAQQAEVKASFPGPGENKFEMVSFVTAIAIPGRTYFVNCNALSTHFDRLRPELDRLEQSIVIAGQ